MKIEIAKTGEAKNGLSLTLAELEEAVKNFKDTRPVSIGHIKTGKEPKYGEIKWVELEKDVLTGEIDLNKKVQPLFDDGFYNKWSAGFKKGKDGMYLHHLALLGAEPPAIEGLKNLEFSDDIVIDKEFETNFSDVYRYNFKFEDIGKIFRSLREWIISKFGQEEADKVTNNWAIDNIKEPIPEEKPDNNGIKNFNDKGDIMSIEELQKQLDNEKNKNKDFSDKLSLYEKKERELKKENLKKSMFGKVPKEKMDLVLEFSDKIEIESKEFSDKKQRDFFEVMTDSFSGLPNMVETKEYDFSDPNIEKKINVQDMINKM